MEMKPGMRLTSIACDTEVMIIKAGAIGKLTCGGHEMCSGKDRPPEKTALAADASAGTVMGKRYVNDDQSFEALCVKPGQGSLALDGKLLQIKETKSLPSSD